jgi:hypothetical protein
MAIPVPTPQQHAAIERTTALFQRDPGVIALVLGGSLAHGFGSPGSDVDVSIVVSDAEHAVRTAEGRTTFYDRDLCGYEGGYVDGKYVSPHLLQEIASRGSEPSRFAFQDARILFSRDAAVARLLAELPRYPVAEKTARIARFHAQFEAWTWYAGEAIKREDPYLLATSASKLTLFAGRMVLAHNEMLFPFHKWFLRVLERAPLQPAGLVDRIRALVRAPTREGVAAFADLVRGFRSWEVGPSPWPVRFIHDTELDWAHGGTAIDHI